MFIKFMKYFSIICALFISTPVFSKPTPGMQLLMDTPASAFDVYLHQLYLSYNRETYYSNPHKKDEIWIFDLKYNYNSNLINMSFHLGSEYPLVSGFTSTDINGKKVMLLKAAKEVATALGLEKIDGLGVRMGTIQMTKIRNGWSTSNFNEEKFKDEIADRTILRVLYAWEDKLLYQVIRSQNGEYKFSALPKN